MTSTGNQSEDWEQYEAEERSRQERIIDAHAAQLAEHFDVVQIICTHYCPQSGTSIHGIGIGNYYTRIAVTEAWLKMAKKK